MRPPAAIGAPNSRPTPSAKESNVPAEVVPTVAPHGVSTRRAAVRNGALLAALATISLRPGAAAQATPIAQASGVLLVQSFGQGSLFPTQGDVGVLPYTAILWDAAARGFFRHDAANGSVGMVATEAVLAALAAAAEPPLAALVSLPADGGDDAAAIWALRLVSGSLGSDPGAVTYQGEPLTGDDSLPWLGSATPDLPDAPQDLGAGYLVIADLAGMVAASVRGASLQLAT